MRALAWTVLLAACGASPSQPRPVASPPAPVSAALDASGAMIAQTHGDLDGVSGDERVSLSSDGVLTAGDAKLTIEIERADPVFSDQIHLAVIPLGGKRRGVVVTMPTSEPEDPPNRQRVYLYERGALIEVFDQVIGSYGGPPLTFSANGVGQYTEDGWMACTRVNNNTRTPINTAMQETVTLALDRTGRKLVETGRTPSGEIQKCDALAACPYVYVVRDGEPQLVGEILRNLRGSRAATRQSLSLGTSAAHVRLVEHKPEVTFLDEIYLDVDGTRVSPRACDATPAPAYCAADGVPYVMHQGDALELAFDVEGCTGSCKTELFARGYYDPTP